MKYYIINGTTIYACETAQPHGRLRDLLIEAAMSGDTIEVVEK